MPSVISMELPLAGELSAPERGLRGSIQIKTHRQTHCEIYVRLTTKNGNILRILGRMYKKDGILCRTLCLVYGLKRGQTYYIIFLGICKILPVPAGGKTIWRHKKMKVLVINCGSSSLKYQLIDMDGEKVLCKGLCERIGMESSMITHEANGHKATTPAIFPTHTEAFAEVVKKMTTGEGKCINDVSEIDAIGHRVVHGGEKFKASCLITDDVINTIRELSPLAPLHNPAGILGIEAARKVFGNIPMVAVFDTAFHSTMPPKAYMYAIPYEYYEKYGVRRYGFHGTSHKYVAHKAAEYLEEPIERLKLITCHLGNGSSIAAVDQGKVVDTSMGMTPLAGLMMGTRCGDLDPSVVNYLKYTLNITGHELDEILNKKSGLLGISGVSSDKRDVEEAAAAGNKRAQLASDMLNYQIKKTIGAYIAAMGGVDAIVFTGGIGEHDAIARAKICHHMDWLGIRIDTEKNKHPVGDVCEITAWGAKVRTLVIATDEELMIARDTKEVIEK